MIEIKPSPTADTRTCDVAAVTKEQLIESSLQHIDDVGKGLAFWAQRLMRAAVQHDYDKLTLIDHFYTDFQTKFEQTGWWDNHRKIHRHHLAQADGVPKDVNLVDVLEYITDCVMAGMARAGDVYALTMSPELLALAFENTVQLLKANVQVENMPAVETFRDRLVREHEELADKLTKLEAFLAKPEEETKVGGDDRRLLEHQSVAMGEYKELLELRMDRLGITYA